ncbi:MAG: hypothetical protein ABIP47_11455 [Saprospiraceae bacterium]
MRNALLQENFNILSLFVNYFNIKVTIQLVDVFVMIFAKIAKIEAKNKLVHLKKRWITSISKNIILLWSIF